MTDDEFAKIILGLDESPEDISADIPMIHLPAEPISQPEPVFNAADLKALARQHSKDAFLRIVATAKDGSVDRELRYKADVYICDRAHGKPMQAVETSIEVIRPMVDAPPQETREQWLERRKKMEERKRLEASKEAEFSELNGSGMVSTNRTSNGSY